MTSDPRAEVENVQAQGTRPDVSLFCCERRPREPVAAPVLFDRRRETDKKKTQNAKIHLLLFIRVEGVASSRQVSERRPIIPLFTTHSLLSTKGPFGRIHIKGERLRSCIVPSGVLAGGHSAAALSTQNRRRDVTNIGAMTDYIRLREINAIGAAVIVKRDI